MQTPEAHTRSMEDATETECGDLARRITHRRQQLGLTSEDLARQAGVAPDFLEYFERHTDVQLRDRTLTAIARVLLTSPSSLLGADRAPTRGTAHSVPGTILEVLTPAECRVHLESGRVGRVVFCAARGPVALPVNFRFADGEVVFHTTVKQAAELESYGKVGFEIDRIDDAFSEGWSVIVTGPARVVDHPDQLVQHAEQGIVAWAGGSRNAVVAIASEEVTGRVILHDGAGDA
jgi:nitroimidazol reductase NimA-like FMN-containing flavoprotein (pyridoxamine 5'-phosphate oxidase superfamily)